VLPSNRFAGNGSSRIAYELHSHVGRRPPWLVLIQGLGFDRSGWAPVISALRRRFRLVLIDNRGSGRSTTADRKFTVADMAMDVTAVLDRSRISRAHVLGASLGGMVAQELAIRFPQRVDRLVLACTTPGWPYGYPMPRASVQRMTEAASLPAEVRWRQTPSKPIPNWSIVLSATRKPSPAIRLRGKHWPTPAPPIPAAPGSHLSVHRP
jgi:3-oxoadipate enol-lactonase